MENSNRTVIINHPGIREKYHNMPDGKYNRVCVLSRNGDRIRLTYTREWTPLSATVNHEGRLSTTGYNQDPDMFEDIERQIAEGLVKADEMQAKKDEEAAKERNALSLELAAQHRDMIPAPKVRKQKKQSTFSEPCAIWGLTA